MTLADLVGTAGTLVVVLAYLGTQLRRLDAAGLGFPLANLAGAALMEMFWMAISVLGIVRWRRERAERPKLI